MTFNQPLDLQNLLVGTLAGDWTIFLFIALIFIVIMAARFKMNNIVMFLMMGIFAVFMANYIPWFYAVIIFISGFAIFFVVAKIIKN
jgi:hypothetical protein